MRFMRVVVVGRAGAVALDVAAEAMVHLEADLGQLAVRAREREMR